jgi:hypothetical protein
MKGDRSSAGIRIGWQSALPPSTRPAAHCRSGTSQAVARAGSDDQESDAREMQTRKPIKDGRGR